MPYLTFEEYQKLGNTEIEDVDFNSLIKKASLFLDIQTRYFYQKHDLSSDPVEFRKNQFKKAIALQVEYMHLTGATTSVDINSPQSWSVDGMSVSEASRYNTTGSNESPSIISDDALMALSGTGLLYRGL